MSSGGSLRGAPNRSPLGLCHQCSSNPTVTGEWGPSVTRVVLYPPLAQVTHHVAVVWVCVLTKIPANRGRCDNMRVTHV